MLLKAHGLRVDDLADMCLESLPPNCGGRVIPVRATFAEGKSEGCRPSFPQLSVSAFFATCIENVPAVIFDGAQPCAVVNHRSHGKVCTIMVVSTGATCIEHFLVSKIVDGVHVHGVRHRHTG